MDKEKIVGLVKQVVEDGVVLEYSKIPEIDLYMDQLTTFTEDKLKTYKRRVDDKILTKTMINNYSKDKLIPPSTNKKYSRSHMALILMVYHLKNSMAINDIGKLLGSFGMEESHINELYDAFTEIQRIENERLESEVAERLDLLAGLERGGGLAEMAIISLLMDANAKIRAAEKILDELVDKTEIKVDKKAEKAAKK